MRRRKLRAVSTRLVKRVRQLSAARTKRIRLLVSVARQTNDAKHVLYPKHVRLHEDVGRKGTGGTLLPTAPIAGC